MRVEDFSFDYPPELVAQEPISPRDGSRMLVLNRQMQTIQDAHFVDFPSYFKSGDLLILNNTKVLPARLMAQKETGGKLEVLFVKKLQTSLEVFSSPSTSISIPSKTEEEVWECLIFPGRGLQRGHKILFSSLGKTIAATLESDAGKIRVLRFPSGISARDLMGQQGAPPLPPYIRKGKADLSDYERYQTTFASKEGAIAAPTAGLHFTPAILQCLKDNGVQVLWITLHVGIGTFQPVETEQVEDHPMQEEYYEISESVATAIQRAKQEGRPITAVGTTTVRALESFFREGMNIKPEACDRPQSTRLFIYPGFRFNVIDRFLTNFHQPSSTPLFLTSAFAGKDFLLKAYAHAFFQRYRLFSYGDCMWVL